MRKLIPIIFLCLASTLLCAHPVHLTVTNVDINSNTGTGSVFFKIFATDLQDAISLSNGVHLSIDEILGDEGKLSWVHDYISKNFSITSSEKISLLFNEHKIEDEHISLYYSFSIEPNTKRIEIFNSLLTDFRPDQTNLVILTFNGKDMGLNFSSQVKNLEVDL